jgi:hypothetical protein
MTILGARALIDIALPTGVDATELFRFQMENGMTGEEAISIAAVGVGEANQGFWNDYGALMYRTESIYARYRQGEGSSMTPKSAEFFINDPVRADLIGHMLPRNDYQDTLSWTRKFLQRADRELIRADVELIKDRWMNRLRFEFWTRALTNTENAIGSAGWDVPWAIGTGANVNFIPPQWENYAFDSTHTHFRFFDDSSLAWSDAFDAGMLELRHHGHLGELVTYISQADIGEVAVLTGFAKLENNNIIIVGGNTSAPVRYARGDITGMPGELIGYYTGVNGTTQVRAAGTIPTNYAFMTKSYGENAPKNPIHVRTEPGVGFGLKVVPQLDRSPERQLDYLLFEATHGIGVGDRTGGVALYLVNGAASYVNPTIA